MLSLGGAFCIHTAVESMLNIKAPTGVEVKWLRGSGWCSTRRHIDCLEKALEWGADYACFLDIDQVYDVDIIETLVHRVEQGYTVISAMVPIRGHVAEQGSKPFQPMAWTQDGDKFNAIERASGMVQRINVIGTGVFMFPVSLLEKLKKPWI